MTLLVLIGTATDSRGNDVDVESAYLPARSWAKDGSRMWGRTAR